MFATLTAITASSIAFLSDSPPEKGAYVLREESICMQDKKLVIQKDALITTDLQVAKIAADSQAVIGYMDGQYAYYAGLPAAEKEKGDILRDVIDAMNRSCDPNKEYIGIARFGKSETLEGYINELVKEYTE